MHLTDFHKGLHVRRVLHIRKAVLERPRVLADVTRVLYLVQPVSWLPISLLQYEGDFRQKLDGVREALNAVADSWSREEKDRCLQETQKSFSYSGGLLRTITASHQST